MTAATMGTGALYAANYVPPRRHAASGPNDMGRSFRSMAYCVAGTMSLLTPQMVEARTGTSNRPIHYEVRQPDAPAAARTQPAAPSVAAVQLALVRQVFNTSMLELANLFGVSRQALYGWQSGAQPLPMPAGRLAALAGAATIFAEAGVAADARTLRRKVTQGRTLADAVMAGEAAAPLAQALVETLKREATQRQRLQAQLAGRKPAKASPADYGAPALDEGA